MRKIWKSLFGWRSPCSLPFVGVVVMRTNGLGMPPSIVLCYNAICVSVLSFHPYVCATFAFQVLDSFLSFKVCLSFSLQGKYRCMYFVVDFVFFFSTCISWMRSHCLHRISWLVIELQQVHNTHFCKIDCWKNWTDGYLLSYTHHSQLMNLGKSDESLSLSSCLTMYN